MAVRIYSTLTGREEDLVPLSQDGTLRMYVCGMTPKFHPHVGHARLFVAMDVIRRYLEYRGYRVKHVQNFTDVDDKIIERAAREGREPSATAQEYSDSYFAGMDRLNVLRAHEYPTVTGYMQRIVDFVADLIEKGSAYSTTDGDVYFAVDTFPGYGALSHRDLNSQLTAVRKELEPGKRDPRDFALWKAAKEGEPSWPSTWGAGRPGWHIECSTMARETLGDELDVHGGGADLIFPHHENEIAQSEALTGRPFARHWVHAGLVMTAGGEKMAHSLENFTTIQSVLDRYDPAAVRLFFLTTHYRKPVAFLLETAPGKENTVARGIEDASAALDRLRRAVGNEPLAFDGPLDDQVVAQFEAAMDSDFNTSGALAPLFDLARDVNRRRDAGAEDGDEDLDRARRTISRLLGVLGIELQSKAVDSTASASIEPYVDLLLDVRQSLRAAKQWALADSIRQRLAALGVAVEDKPDGPTWRLD